MVLVARRCLLDAWKRTVEVACRAEAHDQVNFGVFGAGVGQLVSERIFHRGRADQLPLCVIAKYGLGTGIRLGDAACIVSEADYVSGPFIRQQDRYCTYDGRT